MKKGVSYWKRKADHEFSLFIRRKYATHLGVRCFTCDRYLPLKEIQCGHYISRGSNITRFNELNCRPQCVGCNVFKKGNLIEFRIRLVEEIGEDKVKMLEDMRHQIKQWKSFELEEIYNKYKALNKGGEL